MAFETTENKKQIPFSTFKFRKIKQVSKSGSFRSILSAGLKSDRIISAIHGTTVENILESQSH